MKKIFRHLKTRKIFLLILFSVMAIIFVADKVCFPQAGEVITLRLHGYAAIQNIQDVIQARYLTIVTRRFEDSDDTNFFCDPSGQTRLNSLRVNSVEFMSDTDSVDMPEATHVIRNNANVWTMNFADSGPNAGDAKLNNVTADYVYMADSGPPSQRAGGKYVYDIAEAMNVVDARACDVLVISQEADLTLTKSDKKFDTKVAGVLSETPKVCMGSGENLKPLALAGIVRCNVTTENGPISKGDLLVSSSEPGFAMRADPEDITPGMLVGSAMEEFAQDKGKIYILVNQ